MIKLDKMIALNQLPGKRDQEAVVAGQTRITWGQLESDTRRLVRYFADRGCRRVLFLAENDPRLVPMFAACSTLGISFTGIDYTAALAQVRHCARVTGADTIVYSSDFAREAARLLERQPMDSLRLDTDLGALPADDGALPAAPSRFESIAFTSGTTGFAKAVRRTQSFDAKRFADLVALFGFDSRQIFLATLPFFHVSVVGWARLGLSLGGKLVIADVADAAALAGAIRDERVTALLATPAVLGELLDQLQPGGQPADLEFIITGGKHVPRDLKVRALAFFGPIVNEYYGTTETGVNAIATAADLLAHPASSGRILNGNAVAILDDDRRPLPEGQVGRVAVHSYQNMDGYLSGPPADAGRIAGKEYLVTADYGYLRGDWIFLVSRSFGQATRLDLYGLEDRVRRLPGVADVFAASAGPRMVNLFVAGDGPGHALDLGASVRPLAEGLGDVEIKVTHVERIPYSLSGKVRTGELTAVAGHQPEA
jgi:acyl-CoA synthetase (AMP-forming)/AMP-acid ligase II